MKMKFSIGLVCALSLLTIISCGGGGGGGGTLVSIAITPANPNIAVGTTQQFTATGTYSDGSTADLTASCMWLSSTIAVATIDDETGLATGIASGSSLITASYSAVTGSTTLTVGTTASGKIAFVSTRDDVSEVYVMNADGSGQTRVTSHGGSSWMDRDDTPLWSPDGSQIVFTSWRSGLNQLWMVNSDGTGEAALTVASGATDWNDQAAWSPNGNMIAFTSYRTGATQTYTMNPDGTAQTRITLDGAHTFTHPSWSPSGAMIIADTHWSTSGPDDAGGIYIFSAAAPGAGTQLTHNADDYNAIWSPDGSKIAFYRLASNDTNGDIYVMNSDGSGETRLCEGINPIWSPDGTKIAFLRDVTGYRLFVMNADGSSEVNLMSDFDNLGVTWTPSWSPDSTMLTFADRNVYIVNADGTGLFQVTSDYLTEVGPQWAP